MDLHKLRRQLSDMDKDDVLGLVGLQTRQTTADWLVPALSAFGVGVLVGVGVGLMIAQKPGAELRSDLRSRLSRGDQTTAVPAGTEKAAAKQTV